MDPSFSEDEKRIVLAEMIKTSRLDVGVLAMFVRANQIEPDWIKMQIPHGRNIGQCMQAAEHMAITASSLKRRSSNDYSEHAPKRMAAAERPEYSLHASHSQQHNYQFPPPVAPHVNILPRPQNGDLRDSHTQPKIDPPRKRGRPSRADKAKRDLHPLLPRPPVPGAQQAPTSSVSQPQESTAARPPTAGLAPLAPKRTTVPALLASPVSAARPITPPEAYIPAIGSSASPRRRLSTGSPRDDQATRVPYNVGQAVSSVSESPAKRVLVD